MFVARALTLCGHRTRLTTMVLTMRLILSAHRGRLHLGAGAAGRWLVGPPPAVLADRRAGERFEYDLNRVGVFGVLVVFDDLGVLNVVAVDAVNKG